MRGDSVQSRPRRWPPLLLLLLRLLVVVVVRHGTAEGQVEVELRSPSSRFPGLCVSQQKMAAVWFGDGGLSGSDGGRGGGSCPGIYCMENPSQTDHRGNTIITCL